jgi:hypothetical protein
VKIYPDATVSDVSWAIDVEHIKLVRVRAYGYHIGPATVRAESDRLWSFWKKPDLPDPDHCAWPIYPQDSNAIIPEVCHQRRPPIGRNGNVDRDITCSKALSFIEEPAIL